MRRFLKYGAGIVTLALVLLAGGFYAWGEMSLATPTGAALAAMQSDDRVLVEEGRFISFRPATGQPDTGVIFYFTMTPAPNFAGLRRSPIQQVYQWVRRVQHMTVLSET